VSLDAGQTSLRLQPLATSPWAVRREMSNLESALLLFQVLK